MSNNHHKIKKGLDIHIPGAAEKTASRLPLDGDFAIKPTDYVGVAPRVLVAEGDSVTAGTPLFEDKNNEGIPFVSPVSGTVKSIVRGEKRALKAVIVTGDGTCGSRIGQQLADENTDEIRGAMMASGLWNRLRQRPFGIVPRKDSQPKAVFVTAFDSSPLSADTDFILRGREKDFQHGLAILHKLAGTVYLSLSATRQGRSPLATSPHADIHYFEGPHPSGLIGTQIASISPINKGETVWTVNAQDVAIIGHWFLTGEYLPERVVALCGPCVKHPQYFQMTEGAAISVLTSDRLVAERSRSGHLRIICGDVLSGTSVDESDYLCAGCDKVCVIPEGDYYDFMGWLRPNFRKFSFSRTFLSGFLNNGKRATLNMRRDYDTGQHGAQRPLFVTGEFEKLVPMDIYPLQLIKACIVGDIDLMEKLGIYEIEPEDLALCEFADTSKTEIQTIVRNALEQIRKEC